MINFPTQITFKNTMKLYLVASLLICYLIIQIHAQGNYKKVVHNYDPEAKCLDGTPGLLYVHEGGDSKKILIFFEGGGLCGAQTLAETLESCYQRSKTLLGSSKYWPEELTPQIAQGYLSTNPAINKFSNWTKFVFGYCDGSLHQGYAIQPIKYKDAELYFRGAAVTRSHFDWINAKYNLKGAEKIILTGGSAGGIGVNIWSNYMKQYVNNADVVYPIADSGVFMNFKTHLGDPKLQKAISNLYQVSNKQESTPLSDCNAQNKGEEWKCLFIENSYTTIKGRFMIINSEYDSWSIPNILGYGCLKKGISGQTLSSCTKAQIAYIEKYRAFYRQTMAKFLTVNPQLSIWSIACSNHVYACLDLFYNNPLQEIPTLIGKTIKIAVEQYVIESKRVVVYDLQGWPSNAGCAK